MLNTKIKRIYPRLSDTIHLSDIIIAEDNQGVTVEDSVLEETGVSSSSVRSPPSGASDLYNYLQPTLTETFWKEVNENVAQSISVEKEKKAC